MSTSIDWVARAGRSSSEKLARIAWLPMTMIVSCPTISVDARIACSSSARHIAVGSLDRRHAFLLAQRSGERADLPQVNAVFVVAEEHLDQPLGWPID